MSFEDLENRENNNLSDKMSVKKIMKSTLNSTTSGDKKSMTTCNDKSKTNGEANLLAESSIVKESVDGKVRLISSSDSGKGTANEQNGSDVKSEESHLTNGENVESDRSQSNSSDDLRVEEKLLAADSKFNQEDVTALLEPVSSKQPPSQASESENHSRTVSWVNTCNNEGRQFYNHLDVKKYYLRTRGAEFMNQVFDRINKRDRYSRRVNYDPDKPAAGTESDMEYKFYLDKMGVKKLIGLQGENSEMIRAVNEVDFYVSKDQEDADTEIVTIRGSWENVRKTVADIKNMMLTVGKDICVTHINTAVVPHEFVLQNIYTHYLRIRLNNFESVSITGAIGTTVMMQNISDYRYSRLAELDMKINHFYGTPEGWREIADQPPERVPLPINEFSIVVAPDEQGKYYRAIVESCDITTGEVRVWFLDWGGRTVVSADKLFKLHTNKPRSMIDSPGNDPDPNDFADLPYISLVGNLAGCQLINPDESECFGRFLFQFIRRHMPVKVKAVNMDANGHYSVLLYGNGGECINHMMIDNKWVTSIPYFTYHPFADEYYTPAAYYDPESKEVLDFQMKAMPYNGYYQQESNEQVDDYMENPQDIQSSEEVVEDNYRHNYRSDYNPNERHGYRKYRYKHYQHDHENDGYRRYRYPHDKRRSNGFKGEPQENAAKAAGRDEADKSKGQRQRPPPVAEPGKSSPSHVTRKSNQKVTKSSEDIIKTQENSDQTNEETTPAAATATTTTTTKIKTETTTKTKTKTETMSSSSTTTSKCPEKPEESSTTSATKTKSTTTETKSTTTETKSTVETRTEVETSTVETTTADTTCAAATNCKSSSPASSNPWCSSRVSKSNIYSPKVCDGKSESSKASASCVTPPKAVCCNSSSIASVSLSSSKSSEGLSHTTARSSTPHVSEPVESDQWTVVSSKRRSRRKGKY